MSSGQDAANEWDVNLGIGMAEMPIYPGASSHWVRPVPLANISYGNVFAVGPNGAEVNLLHVDGLRFGPIISVLKGRDQNDDSRLNGLGNISPSIAAGVFAEYQAGPFDVLATVRQAVTHTNYGLLGQIRLDYRTPVVSKGVIFNIGPDIEFANARYNQTWFGVSQVQSAQSGLSAYSPGAGVKNYGIHAGLTVFCSEHVMVRLFGSVERLTGDDANSPIVQDKTQSLVGLGVAYHF